MKWTREVVAQDGKKWIDWATTTGRHRMEQGRDCYESRRGNPWTLFRVTKSGKHIRMGVFKSLELGQEHLQSLIAGSAARRVNEIARDED